MGGCHGGLTSCLQNCQLLVGRSSRCFLATLLTSGVLRSVSSSLLLVTEGSPAIAESHSVCSTSDHVSVGTQPWAERSIRVQR